MAGFSMNYVTTEHIKEEMQTAQKNIQQELEKLDRAIKTNLNEENWVQQSKDVYDQVQRKWTADCYALENVLGSAHSTLDNIMTNFQVVDKMGADNMRQVGI